MIERPLYTNKILSYLDTPFVKILTGVRRCGKSTIMKMVMNELQNRGIEKQRILHYNFDSLEHEDLKTSKALYTELKPRLSEDKKPIYFWMKSRKSSHGKWWLIHL